MASSGVQFKWQIWESGLLELMYLTQFLQFPRFHFFFLTENVSLPPFCRFHKQFLTNLLMLKHLVGTTSWSGLSSLQQLIFSLNICRLFDWIFDAVVLQKERHFEIQFADTYEFHTSQMELLGNPFKSDNT